MRFEGRGRERENQVDSRELLTVTLMLLTETNAATVSLGSFLSDFLSLCWRGKVSLYSQLCPELSILLPQHPNGGIH